MYSVDMYLRVRRAVMMEGMSIREASRVFSLHRDTVQQYADLFGAAWVPVAECARRPNPSASSGGALYRRHRPHP